METTRVLCSMLSHLPIVWGLLLLLLCVCVCVCVLVVVVGCVHGLGLV